MFKQVKIVVWTAFICWMAFFIFSMNQAEAATVGYDSQTVQNQLKLFKSDVCKLFLPYDTKNGEAVEKCDESPPPIPKEPITRAEVKSLLFEITINLCPNGHTDQSKAACWHAADVLLSGSIPAGAHGLCGVRGGPNEVSEGCYSRAFAKDANDAFKAAAATSTAQGKNEALLRDFGRALCHKVNGEHDSPDIFWGITADHSSSCDKTANAMIDDSKSKGQIPSDAQLKGYEAGLSVHVCTAEDQDEPGAVQFGKWTGLESKNPAPQRLACFQAADGIYGGVSEDNLPGTCTKDQLRMAVPSTLFWREAFSVSAKSQGAYVAKFAPGADCYQQIFMREADADNDAANAANIQSQAVQNQTALLRKIGSHDKDAKQF